MLVFLSGDQNDHHHKIVMILNCKHMWVGGLLKAIKMWSQLHSLYDFNAWISVWSLLRAELKINNWTSRPSLSWFSKGCLCLCVSHQEVVRVAWLAGSAITADKRSADTSPNSDIVSLDHNPVLNFSKRGHTSEHDNRNHFLWTRRSIFSCSDAG